MESRDRSTGLDVLRAVAVLMVLVCHSVACPKELSALGSAICDRLKQGGWPGVDLFFVLSGFLIGGLLFKEQKETGTIDIRRFLLRRGFKIYPPFWIFLAFIISWELWKGLPVTIDDILPDLFFFQNYTTGVWGTNWSLGVEEHFYLLMPLSLMLLGYFGRRTERPFRHFPWVFVGVAITCLSLRWWNAPSRFSNFTHLTPTHLRIDGLFFGTFLAYYHVYAHESFMAFCRRFRWWLLAAGVAGFLPPFFLLLEFSWYMKVFGFVTQWLGAGALICFALVRSSAPGRGARALAAIGRTSYATYLWHYWIGLYGLRSLAGVFGFHWNWPIFTAVYYTTTIGAGFLLTRWIEVPFLRLRERLVPGSRARQPVRNASALASPASARGERPSPSCGFGSSPDEKAPGDRRTESFGAFTESLSSR